MSKHNTTELQKLFPDIRERGDSRIRKCQLVMIRMLKIFDYLSKKYEFNYWLEAGTLLGAVRNKGFVPWDCDIDLGMLRKDFDKFMREAAHELPDDIFLQTTDTDPYYQRKGVAKLRDKYSNYAGWAAKSPGLKYHNGLQVEFCIRDTVYSRTVAKWFNYLTFGIKKGLNFSQYISYWRFYALSRESIFPLTYLEFEGSMFPCLNDYEDYLRFHYGDHTKLPPIEHQVPQNGCGEPFIPCNHKEILFWNEQSRIEWVKAWDIEQND